MSSTSLNVLIALGFGAGLLLFAISTAMLRKYSREEQRAAAGHAFIAWPRLVDESLHDAERDLRLDMIERLSLVRSDWSEDILRQAQLEESDPDMLAAIEGALAR